MVLVFVSLQCCVCSALGMEGRGWVLTVGGAAGPLHRCWAACTGQLLRAEALWAGWPSMCRVSSARRKAAWAHRALISK